MKNIVFLTSKPSVLTIPQELQLPKVLLLPLGIFQVQQDHIQSNQIVTNVLIYKLRGKIWELLMNLQTKLGN